MRLRLLVLCLMASALLHALAFGAAALLAGRAGAWPALLVQLVGRHEPQAGHGSGLPPQPERGSAQGARARPAAPLRRAETSRLVEAGAEPRPGQVAVGSTTATRQPAEPESRSQDRPGEASSAVSSSERPFGSSSPSGPETSIRAGSPTEASPSAPGTLEAAIGAGLGGQPGARRGGVGGSDRAGGAGGSGTQGMGLVPAATGGKGGGAGGSEAASGVGAAPEYEPYLLEFRRRIQGSLRYPLAARRRGLSGTAELELFVAPSGRVERIEVVRSSSHALLDEAAMAAVKEATPPPLPPGLPSRSLRVRLPVVFDLH